MIEHFVFNGMSGTPSPTVSFFMDGDFNNLLSYPFGKRDVCASYPRRASQGRHPLRFLFLYEVISIVYYFIHW
jgi:hypothetical protein